MILNYELCMCATCTCFICVCQSFLMPVQCRSLLLTDGTRILEISAIDISRHFRSAMCIRRVTRTGNSLILRKTSRVPTASFVFLRIRVSFGTDRGERI